MGRESFSRSVFHCSKDQSFKVNMCINVSEQTSAVRRSVSFKSYTVSNTYIQHECHCVSVHFTDLHCKVIFSYYCCTWFCFYWLPLWLLCTSKYIQVFFQHTWVFFLHETVCSHVSDLWKLVPQTERPPVETCCSVWRLRAYGNIPYTVFKT